MAVANSTAEKLDRAALRVLDILDRWDERLNAAYASQRKHARNPYRTRITILGLPDGPGKSASPETLKLQAWARNISQGGLSLVFPARLPFKKITVSLNPNAETPSWFHGEIIRARQVQDEFWEHGVKFLGRAEM